MDLQDCIKFANENPVCYLATADGDQPRVRALAMDFADDTGFYFGILSTKDVSRQLKAKPKVEVCFHRRDPMKMMRVAGEIEFLDDIALKTRAYEKGRSLMNKVGIEGPEDPRIEIFRIYTGEAHFWTMNDMMNDMINSFMRGQELVHCPQRIKF